MLGAEVRSRKDFLHAEDLHTPACGFLDQLEVFFERLLTNCFERFLNRSPRLEAPRGDLSASGRLAKDNLTVTSGHI